jgi:hypothetical protein
MGENPSPLGEAFKVDDSLPRQLKLRARAFLLKFARDRRRCASGRL